MPITSVSSSQPAVDPVASLVAALQAATATLAATALTLADRGSWATSTAYAVGDVVTQGALRYCCRTAHTSGTFATDLVASKWVALDATPQGIASGLFNVKDAAYGATGDGTTDDTTAIQAAITAAQAVHGTVYIPRGLYKTTSALSVTANVRIVGESCLPSFGSINTDFNTINLPVASPYLQGAVLMPATAGQNGITITGTGVTVDISDLGIRFADAIKFSNTGHGIFYTPPVVTAQVYRDNGLIGAKWSNVVVFGHDGNHYAFYLTNPIYCTLRHLRSFGGGAMLLENNGKNSGGNQQFYGNCQIDHLYGQHFLSGTADGIRLLNTRSVLNLILFNRPQITCSDLSATFAGTTPPTNVTGQKMFNADQFTKSLTIIAPDFETNTNCGVSFPGGAQSIFVSPGGLINFGVGSTSYVMMKNGSSKPQITQDFGVQAEAGGTPASISLENVAGAGLDLSIANDANRVLTLPGAVKLKSYTTVGRPSASTVAAGSNIYDTTLGKPIWSDGSNWKDAAGNTV